MGESSRFKKVKLFTGIIYNTDADKDGVLEQLFKIFSGPEIISSELEFNFTDYYQNEMGTPLFRQFIAFRDLIDPEELPLIKKKTNEIEKKFSFSGKRSINLDPGYLSDANVIIATTKNHYHRVPLADGIYAHIEYVIKGKDLTFLEWTYPDFKTGEYTGFFQKLLTIYKSNMRDRQNL